MNVTAEELDIIRSALKRFFPKETTEAFLFGSRITGKNRPESDIDILIKQAAPTPLSALGLLKEALENSDLPYKADIVDFHRITEEFRHKAMATSYKLNLA